MPDTDLALPGIYLAADDAARLAARRHNRLKLAEILLPLAAVAFGTIAQHGLRWFGIPAAVVVGLLALMRLVQQSTRAESDWYQARATAEAVKAHAWQYAVRSSDFDDQVLDDKTAEDRFLDQLRADIADDNEMLLPRGAPEVTAAMRDLRAAPLPARRDAYLTGRIDNQRTWYTAAARGNHDHATRLDVLHYGLDAIAIVFAIAVATSSETGLATFVTVAAAAAGAALSWSAVRRYSLLAHQYARTAIELELAREEFDSIETEDELRSQVRNVEARFAVEHSRWMATAGRPGL